MSEHCGNPETCPTNKERERDMKQVKEDYDKTQKQLKETDGKLNRVITEAAVTNSKVDDLVKEIRRDRADNQRLHEMHLEEFKSVHKRVTDNRVEAVTLIGDAKLNSVEADGDIKAKQASNLSMADLFKLAALIVSILTIYNLLSPYVGN